MTEFRSSVIEGEGEVIELSSKEVIDRCEVIACNEVIK